MLWAAGLCGPGQDVGSLWTPTPSFSGQYPTLPELNGCFKIDKFPLMRVCKGLDLDLEDLSPNSSFASLVLFTSNLKDGRSLQLP